MSEKLFDALEVCLRALETGADLEAVLRLYPQWTDELRPLLAASIQARSLALTAIPEAAAQRGRARVLQHANGLRKSVTASRKGRSFFAFPRLATSLAITLIFLASGTGLVSASSAALPGDHLYPVKRSWEDLRLLLVFSPGEREGLESEFEQERLDEISVLLTEGRKETIAFAGLVTAQNILDWKVSGITVMITPSTHLPSDAVAIGAPVMVIGHTNAQGFVEADVVEVMGPGASLPPLEPSDIDRNEVETGENSDSNSDDVSVQQPGTDETSRHEFKGVVESMNGNMWTINGQQVNVNVSAKQGAVTVGALVEFEGYYSIEGQFIVTKIEVKSGGLIDKNEVNNESSKDDSGSSSPRNGDEDQHEDGGSDDGQEGGE